MKGRHLGVCQGDKPGSLSGGCRLIKGRHVGVYWGDRPRSLLVFARETDLGWEFASVC